MKQIIILIPHTAKTGGPEALHQLSDALIRQGHDARIWYVIPSDRHVLQDLFQQNGLLPNTGLALTPRPNTVPDYDKYQTRLAEQIVLNRDTCIVFPETYVDWLPFFQHCQSVVWWLSVDNALGYMAIKGLNLNLMRFNRVLHAYQSSYAKAFITALGCKRMLPLSDYTPGNTDTETFEKTDIAINANHKVLFDVGAIAARLERETGAKVHQIQGMTREQVYEALGRSKIFIDLGNFPGKDRLAREALIRQCCVFVMDVGAARDYLLPEEFYFAPDEVNQVFTAAREVMERYPFYLELCHEARLAVARERMVFEREVAGVAGSLA